MLEGFSKMEKAENKEVKELKVRIGYE